MPKVKKLKWITQRKKTDPEIPYTTPIWLGNLSNGEFFLQAGERERKLREKILQRCDEFARKKNMDRREFIGSAMGMATTLSVLNLAAGCGDKDGMMDGKTMDRMMNSIDKTPYDGGTPPKQVDPMSGGKTSSMSSSTDGGFVVTPEACLNDEFADRLFNTKYFILDFQTHHTREGQAGLCLTGDGTPECTSPATYIRQIFEESETTVAVLSGLPSPIDESINDLTGFRNEDMRSSRDRVNAAAHLTPTAGERMIAHCQISPKNKPDANARMMAESKRMYDTRGWKCYPPTEGGWFLHENDAFIQTAIDLGEPLVCAHKGFPFQGWSRVHANPMPDVAEVAKRYPDVNFVIYHSAYDSGHMEGPYDPNPSPEDGGVDRLAKVVSENDLTNKNVYAEMGSAWAISMRDPVVAQHYVGKMLKYVGQERLVWGSECVWYGCPQNQIEAFKVFQISTEFQEKYGYPEFTDQLRRQIFGLTGAKLYRVDPELCRYKVDRSLFAQYKQEQDDRWGPRRHALNPPYIRTRRQLFDLWRDRLSKGEFA